MPIQVGVESGAVAARPQGLDQAEVDQQPERPVDGVQRHRRDARANPLIDRFRVEMITGPRNLAENLGALMGQLGSRVAASPLEARHPVFDILLGNGHDHYH